MSGTKGHSGRPPKNAIANRIYRSVRLDPATDAAIVAEKQPGESYGAALDRIVDRLVAREIAMTPKIDITSIEITDLAGNYFDGQDTEGVDTAASMERYDEILTERLRSDYPQAEVTIRHQPGSGSGGHTRVAGSQPLYETNEGLALMATVEEAVQAHEETLYNDMQQWLVFTK